MAAIFAPTVNSDFLLTTKLLVWDEPLICNMRSVSCIEMSGFVSETWVKDFFRYLEITWNVLDISHCEYDLYERDFPNGEDFLLVLVFNEDRVKTFYLVKLVQEKFSLTSRVLLKENDDGEGDCCGQILLCGDYLLVSSPTFVHLFRREDLKCVQSRFDIGSCQFDPVSGTIVALDHSHHGVDGILYRPTRLYGLAFPSLESAAQETSCSEGILSTVYQSSTTYKMHPYNLYSPAGTEDMAIDDSGRIFLLEKKLEEHCYLHVLAPDFSLLFSSKALVGMNSYSLLQGPNHEIVLRKIEEDEYRHATYYILSLQNAPSVNRLESRSCIKSFFQLLTLFK